MAILNLVKIPNDKLRVKSNIVKRVDSEVKKIVDDMLDTMYHANGIGLAAIQVDIPKNIIVIDLQENVQKNPLVLINLKINHFSKKKDLMSEQCLSVPGKSIDVLRSIGIKGEYWDYNGNNKNIKARGFLSRVIQHEYDHTIGKLLVDYLV